jgi:hypothetical protein
MSEPYAAEEQGPDFVQNIRAAIAANLTRERPKDAQIALSRFAALIDQLSATDIDKVRAQVSSVLPALTTERPNIDFAERAIVNIGNTLLQAHGGFAKLFYKSINGSPICSVYFALFCSLLSFVGLFGVCYLLDSVNLLSDFLNRKEFVLTVSFAFLGGMVSIAFRLDTTEIERVGLVPLFLTNLMKPYIGAMFGIIVYCIIESKLITIAGVNDHTVVTLAQYKTLSAAETVWSPYGGAIVPVSNYLFYFVAALVGFISGFSERFATDLIDKSSQVFSGGSQLQAGPNQTTTR